MIVPSLNVRWQEIHLEGTDTPILKLKLLDAFVQFEARAVQTVSLGKEPTPKAQALEGLIPTFLWSRRIHNPVVPHHD